MNWLIWKDYRLNRLIVLVAVFLLVAPHAAAVISAWRGVYLPGPLPRLAANLMLSALYSLGLSQLILALVGGNAIACERADRSAEFLASLPVSRGRILGSKLLVALGLTAMVWVPNLVILGIVTATWNNRPPDVVLQGLKTFAIMGITWLTFFCVAWLFSSMLESPTFSICAGFITPFLVVSGISLGAYLLDFQGPAPAWWYCGLCLAISAASFAGGTLYYLRRVEP